MITYDVFLKAISKEPKKHLHKLACADWLEEQGKTKEAEAWRYLAKKKKRPWRPSEEVTVSIRFAGKKDSYRHCQLPNNWLVLMEEN